MGRCNLADAPLASSGPYSGKLDPKDVVEGHGHSEWAEACKFLVDLFLQGDVDPEVHSALLKTTHEGEAGLSPRLRQFAYSVVTLPEFHLA